MASLTEAMKWYSSPSGPKVARLKYHYAVEFFSSKYANIQSAARLIFDSVRTVELPKYSIETEVVNAWNVRQLVPTKINFEPVSIAFNDTIDNRFQDFLKLYLNTVSGSFQKLEKSVRTGFDSFGLRSLAENADAVLDKIVITRFYGANEDLTEFQNPSIVTLWRPKIIDVQHDTLDYSSSDAITWQLSLRYESITYGDDPEEEPPTAQTTPKVALPTVPTVAKPTIADISLPETPRQWNWSTGNLENVQGSDLPPSA
jgi:hypothetical protein